jgi:hypothetical protein
MTKSRMRGDAYNLSDMSLRNLILTSVKTSVELIDLKIRDRLGELGVEGMRTLIYEYVYEENGLSMYRLDFINSRQDQRSS